MPTHRIIVFGATGPSGRVVLAQAAEAGHQVTGFVRDPAKASGFPETVRIATGDARDAASVAAAIADHDVVISALGIGRSRREPACAAGIRNIIAAMKQHGVRRLIALLAYGTADSRHGLYGWMINTVAPAVQRDKEAMEAAIAEGGLDWTVIRPPVPTNGPATGKLQAATGLVLAGFKRISRTDLAAWILDEIDARRFVCQMPVLAPG